MISWRPALLLSFVLGTLVWILLLDPIPQDLAFHKFADRRTLWGIPNAIDVLSNIPFLLAGIFGLRFVIRSDEPSLPKGWVVFFAGLCLVAFGSAYYHWNPNNETLVWDRLPITVGFMGLFVALITEYVDPRMSRILLIPALLVGVGSVMYWNFADDLRLYAWVQFMPMGIIVLLLLIYRSRFSHSWLLGTALGLYVAAKASEIYDVAVFERLAGMVSGHSIKHVLAAAGGFALIYYLSQREPGDGFNLLPSSRE